RVLGDPLLLVAGVEDRRAVAAADVVALPVLRRRVVDLEEELEQVAERDELGVEDDLDRLGVTLVVAVGRVGDVTAGVADPGRDPAGPLADEILHAPEAAAGQDRGLALFAHGGLPSSKSLAQTLLNHRLFPRADVRPGPDRRRVSPGGIR